MAIVKLSIFKARNSVSNTNLRFLTGVRGVAALFVVVYHFTNAKMIFFWNGYLAVELFLLLAVLSCQWYNVIKLEKIWPSIYTQDFYTIDSQEFIIHHLNLHSSLY